MIEASGSLAAHATVCVTEERKHTSYSNPDIQNAVHEFLLNGDREAFDDACTDVIEP